MMNKPRTPPETLIRSREIALANGLRHVYLGNIHSKAGSSTYCDNCGALLIGRDWHELSDWRIEVDGGGRLPAPPAGNPWRAFSSRTPATGAAGGGRCGFPAAGIKNPLEISSFFANIPFYPRVPPLHWVQYRKRRWRHRDAARASSRRLDPTRQGLKGQPP